MSKPFKTVSICGCGWLGLPLAESLVNAGFTVTGSKRHHADLALLKEKHIQGVTFDLFDESDVQAESPLFQSEVLVVNIPPGRRTIEREAFVGAMKRLVDNAKQGGVQQLIFISTTSVYGNVMGTVIESTPCEPDTESGKAHLEIEDYVRAQFPDTGVVLRLSGLVGADRHPAKYLAGREGIASGLDPVNLIHRDDCIAAIKAVIEGPCPGDTFHLSALEHPSRQDFYGWAAEQMGLSKPHFVDEGGEGKEIVAERTLRALNLTLLYPSPYDMPLPELSNLTK